MPATFKNIDEAFEIGIGIGVGMFDRIANAGLGCEMDHNWEIGA